MTRLPGCVQNSDAISEFSGDFTLKLVLDQAKAETSLTRVMTFRSDDPLPVYAPGAHMEFDLGDAGKRCYSLVDWPDSSSDVYSVAVQREDAGEGGSIAMHQLSVGQSIEASPPRNNFKLIDGSQPVLLLAGGIGITPLISMATQLQQQGRAFQLHYCARDATRMAFAHALNNAFDKSVFLHPDDTRPLNLDSLMSSQANNTTVYLCGPRGMIDAARQAAMEAGIAEAAIHIELFSSAGPRNADSAFEVEVSSTGQVVNVAKDQSIIEALESAGLDVMYDCQRGDCGICQCDVISGIPDHRDVVLSDEEKASGKVMQICVSRAKSPRLVIDI